MKKACCALLCVVLTLPALAVPAADSIEGAWEGVASSPPNPDIPFSVTFTKQEGALAAAMDIPSEGISGLMLQDVSLEGKTLKFVVPVPDGPVQCSAEIQEDGTIKGVFDQAGQTGTFTMKRKEKE